MAARAGRKSGGTKRSPKSSKGKSKSKGKGRKKK